MKYSDIKLNENIKKALAELGYENMTKIQELSYEDILSGKDIVGMSSTGSGKTAAFMIPTIENIQIDNKSTQVLVITPTRELAIQIVQETRKYLKYTQGINALAIYGGQEYKSQAIALRKGVKIVVGTPGRIRDLIKKKILKLDTIKTLVLDEADEMLSMGFYEEVMEIVTKVPKKAQKLLFSATIDNRVKDIAQKEMKKAVYIEAMDNDTMLTDNITQIAIETKEAMKFECCYRIIKKEDSHSTIVFTNTKKKTIEIFKYLKEKRLKVKLLNSDIDQKERNRVIKELKEDKLDVVVATDVLARGIDIKDLELVINIDIPQDNEYYVHRIGRTARKGNSGVAYTLYTGKQIERIKEIEDHTRTKFKYEEVPLETNNANQEEIDLPISKRGLYILTINLGKKDSIKAKDIIGAIGALTGIKSENIGIIEVGESSSTIELKKEYVLDVKKAFTNGKIKGKDVNVISNK